MALGIVQNAARTGADQLEVARLHFAVGEVLGLPNLVARILALPRQDRWQTMARAALRDDLHTVHARLTGQILDGAEPGQDVGAMVADWEKHDELSLQRAAETFTEICADEDADLAKMSVALRVVRTLLESP
jgi:glutamate dehydrogenase